MTNLVAFSGTLRSGKDTAAKALLNDGWGYLSFAKALKDFTYAVNPLIPLRGTNYRLASLVDAYGWERAKDDYPEVRAILQRVGTDAGREVLGEDVWVNAALSHFDPSQPAVFTDCRFPNEAKAVHDRGGLVIRVKRLGYDAPADAHVSETALDDYPFDAVIHNNGTIAELHDWVRYVVVNIHERLF